MVKHWAMILVWLLVCGGVVSAQEGNAAGSKVELGSRTAKEGVQNADEIRDKFNNRMADADVGETPPCEGSRDSRRMYPCLAAVFSGRLHSPHFLPTGGVSVV